MSEADPLELFLPPVGAWFRQALGTPTAAQRDGWPAVAAGRHTLILAPTGSGKTLAAFLACLDGLWRQDPLPRGVQVLYVSPLKALNNDVHRNLQVPLAGVAAMAQQMQLPLPAIEVAVRTGDTPASERQRFLRRPPHVLITTPESLHLLLTSRAREALRSVTHCIIDEIHALCPNKRGVFLALLLERLAALTPRGFVRIGLSATQRPLEEVARYLGGATLNAAGELVPRPVTIVDAGLRKDLDLRVVWPGEAMGQAREASIWPAIHRYLGDAIRRHRSTLVFANNRRQVERITASLNETEELARAHHGSVALEVRQQTEEALKEGRLPAVVSTASLELGIDMGAVDLVCQVESPGSVARGLQRVGRAGHLVGAQSKGRLLAKTPADLVEQAVLAHEMAAGHVEALRPPRNCLDVLAQQVVAMVAVEDWDVSALHALVRQASPYRDLSPRAFEGVLEMISGRYRLTPGDAPAPPLAALQPRVSWDRVHNWLRALPGSRSLALVSGGTIPDTGQYPAYLPGGVRIGELDEEFIYERRVGEAFLLGTNAWRLERIEADRVIVTPAEGAPALVPFWRGERTGRTYDLGSAVGRFLGELVERLEAPDCLTWLQDRYFLDAAGGRALRSHVRRQLAVAGRVPTDRCILVEAFRDQLGDWQIAVLSPLGAQLHFALRLALEAELGRRLGYSPQCLHHDDGILIRLADTEEPPLDLLAWLTPENVEELVLAELADSALFALRFRQNAARALLLPRTQPGRRAPLWLQRLRGRDLLQVARRHPDFPIVAETFRECLHDHLDLLRLRHLLGGIRSGTVEVVGRRAEAPSPFAAGLLFAFTAAFMYGQDRTEASAETPPLDRQLLEQLVAPDRHDHLLDPRAVQQVERRLRGVGRPPRSAPEMAEWLRRLGDLRPSELEGPMAALVAELESEGLARRLVLTGCREGERWVHAEHLAEYQQAFGLTPTEPVAAQQAGEQVLGRFLQTHALVSLRDVLDRYPFEETWARRQLEAWAAAGRAVRVESGSAESGEGPSPALHWSVPANLEQIQRGTLGLRRSEVLTCPPTQFADFLLRWQGLHPATRHVGPEGVAAVLACLEGVALPADLWEQAALPARVPDYQPRWLDDVIASGGWTWVGAGSGTSGPGPLTFWSRDRLALLPPPPSDDAAPLPTGTDHVLEWLRTRGASFVADIAHGTGLAPSDVRSALWQLTRRGLVTNDQLDVVRRGEEQAAAPEPRRLHRAAPRPIFSRQALAARRRALHRPEGRWALLAWGRPDPEAHAVCLAELLLHRYGVVARELAALDSAMLPWRILYEVLSRMELAGDVRRGYFVEGLSGAQFALPEAIPLLEGAGLPSTQGAPVVLLHTLDPANLYGAGAPFDLPLLDGGTRSLARRGGNWLVLRAGRPVLVIEQQGKRLTALPSAGPAEVTEALACLPALLVRRPGGGTPHRITVEEWNGQPVAATDGKAFLEAAGFVRDYQGMTLYAAWRS